MASGPHTLACQWWIGALKTSWRNSIRQLRHNLSSFHQKPAYPWVHRNWRNYPQEIVGCPPLPRIIVRTWRFMRPASRTLTGSSLDVVLACIAWVQWVFVQCAYHFLQCLDCLPTLQQRTLKFLDNKRTARATKQTHDENHRTLFWHARPAIAR